MTLSWGWGGTAAAAAVGRGGRLRDAYSIVSASASLVSSFAISSG